MRKLSQLVPYRTYAACRMCTGNVMVAVQAYGHEGLGILAVAGVPAFPELRQKLLPLTAQFAVRAI